MATVITTHLATYDCSVPTVTRSWKPRAVGTLVAYKTKMTADMRYNTGKAIVTRRYSRQPLLCNYLKIKENHLRTLKNTSNRQIDFFDQLESTETHLESWNHFMPLCRATTADIQGITDCVSAAYRHYISSIGQSPATMFQDYHQADHLQSPTIKMQKPRKIIQIRG